MITTAMEHAQTFAQTLARSSYKMGCRASGCGKVVLEHEHKTAFALAAETVEPGPSNEENG